MGIKVQPYTPEFEGAVHEFNQRLEKGASDLRYPKFAVPEWLPRGCHPKLFNEMFLAIDDGGAVRGGYTLKHQEFLVHGRVEMVANYSFPLSEGVVDRRYGMVGVSMILDAQKRNPLLFDLGMGGKGHPSARVMQGVGWSVELVPFFFRVIDGFKFLRNIVYLRRSLPRRLALDLAAFSGAGWMGVKLDELLRHRSASPNDTKVEVVPGFGDWADEIWYAGKPHKGFTAVRDRAALEALYPSGNDRFIIVKVSERDEAIGWAVCLDTQMSGHSHFGNMRVGAVADCFAKAEKALAVLAAVDRLLSQRNVDLIVSNQSDQQWCDAFRTLGYREGPSNFALACSKELNKQLGSLDDALPLSHINRGDGDGPINL